MILDLEMLCCPDCGERSSDLTFLDDQPVICCQCCGQEFAFKGKWVDFVGAEGLKTRLEDNPDAEIHKYSSEEIDKAYRHWRLVLDQLEVEKQAVLEVGAGTGRLTDGLVAYSGFENFWVTDLSPTFLQQIESRYSDNRGLMESLNFVVCDANNLPFKSGGFDLVVGRSILHHLLDYEKTLSSCLSVLKEGGKAIFFEPVLQGKLLVSMFIINMLKIEKNYNLEIFSEEQRERMGLLIQHQLKAGKVGHDLSKLQAMEDKYIFDAVEMKKKSKALGFTHFQYLNTPNLISGNVNFQPSKSYRIYIFHHLREFGVTQGQLDNFSYLFESFSATFSEQLNQQLYTPMGYFVFEK